MNCSHNNMTQLPSKLPTLTEQLIMTDNNLESLKFAEKNLSEIKVFDLQRSNIKYISDEVYKTILLNAEFINLSDNKLTSVSSLLKGAKLRTKLSLSNNPFDCNCDMMWMRDWLQNASKNKENITCSTGRWKGKFSNWLMQTSPTE